MREHVLGQKNVETFPRHVLGDAVQDPKPRFLSSPEQNNHPDLEGRADGGGIRVGQFVHTDKSR
jgi:hypothetical protein